MNVPDLRNVDFDAYRRQAHEMRQQAMGAFIDRAVASLRAALRPRSPAAAVPSRAARPAACPA